jgi:hypothetical protein
MTPRCHQPLKGERLGIPLSLLKCRIIDAIATAGDLGASSEEIRNTVYEGGDRDPAVVRIHIGQIRDALAGTDFQIVASARGPRARWHIRNLPPRPWAPNTLGGESE